MWGFAFVPLLGFFYINILVFFGKCIDSVGVVKLTSLGAVVVLVGRTEINETHIVRTRDVSVCLLVFRCIGRGRVQSIEQPESVDVLVVTELLLGFLDVSVGWCCVVDGGFVCERAYILVHRDCAIIYVDADVVGLPHIVLFSVRGTVAVPIGDER